MKRLRTTDPLTADDIAERFAAAMLRVWKIASDIEQLGIWDEVKHSQYLSLAGELGPPGWPIV